MQVPRMWLIGKCGDRPGILTKIFYLWQVQGDWFVGIEEMHMHGFYHNLCSIQGISKQEDQVMESRFGVLRSGYIAHAL